MKKPTLVFICTENSARSLMAEAIAKQRYSDRFDVFSAGTAPTVPDPNAIKALARHSFATADLNSKSLTELSGVTIDYAIILCSKANQECAEGLAAKQVLSWDFNDPKVGNTDKTYETTIHELAERLNMFVLLYDKEVRVK